MIIAVYLDQEDCVCMKNVLQLHLTWGLLLNNFLDLLIHKDNNPFATNLLQTFYSVCHFLLYIVVLIRNILKFTIILFDIIPRKCLYFIIVFL